MADSRKKDAIILVQQHLKYTRSASPTLKYVDGQLNLMLGDHVIKSISRSNIGGIRYTLGENASESVTRLIKSLNLPPTCNKVWLYEASYAANKLIAVDDVAACYGNVDSINIPLNIENVVDVFTKLKDDGVPVEHYVFKLIHGKN
jgi:hypothetical protein